MGTQVNVGDHIKIKIQIITCYQVLMITYGPVWSNVRRTPSPPFFLPSTLIFKDSRDLVLKIPMSLPTFWLVLERDFATIPGVCENRDRGSVPRGCENSNCGGAGRLEKQMTFMVS